MPLWSPHYDHLFFGWWSLHLPLCQNGKLPAIILKLPSHHHHHNPLQETNIIINQQMIMYVLWSLFAAKVHDRICCALLLTWMGFCCWSPLAMTMEWDPIIICTSSHSVQVIPLVCVRYLLLYEAHRDDSSRFIILLLSIATVISKVI